MKSLTPAEIKTKGVELDVYECGCGFYIGLDSTYLDQVGEIKAICPACGEIIETESE